MSTNIKIEEMDPRKWDQMVDNSLDSNFFYKSNWLKSLEEGLGLEPYHLMITKSGNVVAVFPNFVESVLNTPFKRLYSIPLHLH